MGFVNLLLAEITADYSVQDKKGAVFIKATTADWQLAFLRLSIAVKCCIERQNI